MFEWLDDSEAHKPQLLTVNEIHILIADEISKYNASVKVKSSAKEAHLERKRPETQWRVTYKQVPGDAITLELYGDLTGVWKLELHDEWYTPYMYIEVRNLLDGTLEWLPEGALSFTKVVINR